MGNASHSKYHICTKIGSTPLESFHNGLNYHHNPFTSNVTIQCFKLTMYPNENLYLATNHFGCKTMHWRKTSMEGRKVVGYFPGSNPNMKTQISDSILGASCCFCMNLMKSIAQEKGKWKKSPRTGFGSKIRCVLLVKGERFWVKYFFDNFALTYVNIHMMIVK